jgi:orotate phosphoribosyltransferase
VAINPDNIFGDIKFNDLVLWILAVGGLPAILDYAGFLPQWLARWIARNRLESTLQALKRIGVRVSWNEEQQTLNIIQRTLSATSIMEPAYKVHLRHLLDEDSFVGSVDIGVTRKFTSEKFIDVMGGSTDPARVKEYARILNTHLGIENIPDFDLIATPKEGTPILGYEFSVLTGKPLILGVIEKAKNASQIMGNHVILDYPKSLLLQDKRALLVDDSTTGGRKMMDLAEELRRAGVTVEDAFVLFEPKGKGAREKLKRQGINLHAIVDGPQGRF